MKARLLIKSLRTGEIARNYIRLVKESFRPARVEVEGKSNAVKAQAILESIEQQDQPDPLDTSIEGKDLLKHMDQGLEDSGYVPFFYTDQAKREGVGIYPGSYAIIVGDSARRKYRTIKVYFHRQSVQIRDLEDGNRFEVPWDLLEPLPVEDQDTPYWFSSAAREKDQDLRVGDYVGLLGSDQQYELMNIYWDGNVRVRRVGSLESLGLPWRYVIPWKERE